jgi:hypothetical protein
LPGVLLRGVAHPADPVLQDAVFDPFRDDRLNVELFVRVHVIKSVVLNTHTPHS